jgi:hypothetical protein
MQKTPAGAGNNPFSDHLSTGPICLKMHHSPIRKEKSSTQEKIHEKV